MGSPTVSVVIASGAGSEFLFRYFNSLREQAAAEEGEVIVVERCGSDHAAQVEKKFAFVTFARTEFKQRPRITVVSESVEPKRSRTKSV